MKKVLEKLFVQVINRSALWWHYGYLILKMMLQLKIFEPITHEKLVIFVIL